jgi:hypothetical protein
MKYLKHIVLGVALLCMASSVWLLFQGQDMTWESKRGEWILTFGSLMTSIGMFGSIMADRKVQRDKTEGLPQKSVQKR